MKGFRFRLEPVLALRRHREQSLQSQLAESQRVLETEVAHRQAIDGELKNQAEHLAASQGPGPLDLDSVHLGNAYLNLLESRLRDQTGRVEKQAERVVQERNEVLRASQDKKALEKLREGLLQSFAREMTRQQDQAAEEAATTRHAMKKQPGNEDA